jgi:hypothetical protein
MLFKFMLYCDRRSVGQFVLVSGPHMVPLTRFLLLSDICGLLVAERPPWREDGSVIYSYISLPLSGPSLLELISNSYCLVWDSQNLEDQIPVLKAPPPPQEQGGPVIPPGTGVPFCHLLWHIRYWCGSQKEKNHHYEDQDVGGWIILE